MLLPQQHVLGALLEHSQLLELLVVAFAQQDNIALADHLVPIALLAQEVILALTHYQEPLHAPLVLQDQ